MQLVGFYTITFTLCVCVCVCVCASVDTVEHQSVVRKVTVSATGKLEVDPSKAAEEPEPTEQMPLKCVEAFEQICNFDISNMTEADGVKDAFLSCCKRWQAQGICQNNLKVLSFIGEGDNTHTADLCSHLPDYLKKDAKAFADPEHVHGANAVVSDEVDALKENQSTESGCSGSRPRVCHDGRRRRFWCFRGNSGCTGCTSMIPFQTCHCNSANCHGR